MLTDAQYSTVATDITVTHASEFAEALAATDAQAIAAVYNLLASPDYWVWRTSLSIKEVYETTSGDSTTWSTTAYIARSAAERDAWRDVFAIPGVFNPSLANARAGLADIFSGAPGAAQRTHLLALGRRTARRIEQLLATGAGTTASPSVMGFEGVLGYREVSHAVFGGPLP